MKLKMIDRETGKTIFAVESRTPEDYEMLEWLFAIIRGEDPPFGTLHMLKLAIKKRIRLFSIDRFTV